MDMEKLPTIVTKSRLGKALQALTEKVDQAEKDSAAAQTRITTLEEAPAPDTKPITDRIAALEDRPPVDMQLLADRITALEDVPPVLVPDMSPLAARVKELEDRPVPSIPDVAPITARVKALEDKPAPVIPDVAPLTARVAALEGVAPPQVPDVSGLAPKASPALSGTPTAPTPSAADATTKIATTAFVKVAMDAAGVRNALDQSARVQTAADGTVTWTYPTAFPAGVVPTITPAPESAGRPVTINIVSVDNTKVKLSAQRSKLISIAVLGANVDAFEIAAGVWIHVRARTPS